MPKSTRSRREIARRTAAVVLVACGILAGASLSSATAETTPSPDAAKLKAEFYQSFRGRSFDYQKLVLVGRNAEKLARLEPEGLRIRIPDRLSVGSRSSIGLAPRFRVHGDFEITTSYEIVKAAEPKSGFGLALALYVETEAASQNAVTVERGVLVKKGSQFTSTAITGPPDQRKYKPRRVPGKSSSGKLRMTRVGPKVTTHYSDGDEPFRFLSSLDLGPEDLAVVRLGADNGNSGSAFDVRLADLAIRAEALPDPDTGPASRLTLLWVVAVLVLSGLAVLGIVVWRRGQVAQV